MAQVGQTSPSGGREWSINEIGGPMRQVTIPDDCTLNHIGIWVRESTAANTNDLKGAIYSTAGVLQFETAILTATIGSTVSFSLEQLNFSGQSLPAGTYILVVSGEGTNNAIAQGQTDSAGLPTYIVADSGTIHPNFPADASAFFHSDAARAWDIYLDYTPSAGAYTITADAGNYVITGQTATLIGGGLLTAEAGSYTILGSEGLRDITATAEQGSYSLNGQVAGVRAARIMTAQSSSYSLLGQATNLFYSAAASVRKALKGTRFLGFRLRR